jgi:hypothetical protein
MPRKVNVKNVIPPIVKKNETRQKFDGSVEPEPDINGLVRRDGKIRFQF